MFELEVRHGGGVLNSPSVEPAQASPLEASSLATSAPLSPIARIAWAVLIIATLAICYFSHLGALGFVGPDEPRYAWIARDMAESGDWITPRLYGKPWFEKPPLYYWSAAVSFKLFGVSEVAARLPSAVAALLATLAIAWLAWRLYGAETARWLLLLLPTSVGMIGFSHAAATDMLFASTLTLALVAAAGVLGLLPATQSSSFISLTPSTSFTSVLFGFFLGLAVLAKGPAALVLMSGAVFFWAVFTKRWRDAFRLFHPAAIVAFCVTALPWYIVCARRNRNFFGVFIVEHNFKRYITPEFQHIQPFWFYGAVLLVAFLPWTALFLWSLISGIARLWRTGRSSDATLLLLCWSAFCVLFFTISKSKLPGYILPAIPAGAVLMLRPLSGKFSEKTFSARLLFSAIGLTLMLIGILASRFSSRIPVVTDLHTPLTVIVFSMTTVLGGAFVAILAMRGGNRECAAAATILLLFLAAVGSEGLWELDEGVSARRAIALATQHLTIQQMQNVTTYKLRRDFKYQVDFYLHRETKEWSPTAPNPSVIFTSWNNHEELEQSGVRCAAYAAVPAVTICEDSRGGRLLLSAAAGGKMQ